MGFLRLAAAGLLILCSTYSHAEVRTIQAGNVNGLIKAVLDANANPSEWMIVVVKGTGVFEFTEEYENSGFVLPSLEGGKLAILIEKADVIFEVAPQALLPGKSSDDSPPVRGFLTASIEDLEITDFVMAYLGGVVPVDLTDRFPTPKVVGASPPIAAEKSRVVIDGIEFTMGKILLKDSLYLGRDIKFRGGFDLTFEDTPDRPEPESIIPELASLSEEVNDFGLSPAKIKELKALAMEYMTDFSLWDSSLTRGGSVIDVMGPSSVYVGRSYLGTPAGPFTTIEVNMEYSGNRKSDHSGFSSRVPRGTFRIVNSVIDHPNTGQAIEIENGKLELRGVTVAGEDVLGVGSGGSVAVYRSILGTPAGSGSSSDRNRACEIESGAGAFTSLGYNLGADDSCPLNKSTDRRNSNPRLVAPAEGSVIPGLANNSPAIDGGPSGLVGGNLPCGTTDLLSAARPQDGNGDGKAECDIGAIEIASRGSIDRRQSGAYFDTGRNGEGVFVEMLGPDIALVYLFSYRPNGDPFWALGVGRVVGNGIVIGKQDFVTTRGGIFGPDFDPADVEVITFADVSLSFPDCRNTTSKGTLAIAPNEAMGFGAVLSTTERLTFILDCSSRNALGPGLSGSFVDPAHNGEGIILQVINADTVLVQWFTYDDQGNQYWIQGIGTLSGDTITVAEALAFRGPSYGPNYDAADLEFIPWGTIMIEFNGCHGATFTYDSIVAGFGKGRQDMQRLTSLFGVDCP